MGYKTKHYECNNQNYALFRNATNKERYLHGMVNTYIFVLLIKKMDPYKKLVIRIAEFIATGLIVLFCLYLFTHLLKLL